RPCLPRRGRAAGPRARAAGLRAQSLGAVAALQLRDRRHMSPRAVPKALLEEADASLLDLVDNVLTKGVLIDGEIVRGLAGVDLLYLRLSAILCAADRIMKPLR